MYSDKITQEQRRRVTSLQQRGKATFNIFSLPAQLLGTQGYGIPTSNELLAVNEKLALYRQNAKADQAAIENLSSTYVSPADILELQNIKKNLLLLKL
jgi:hypothetical protein